MTWAPGVSARRKKVPAYKRQHKATRLKEMLAERAALAKAAASLDRKLGRSSRKTEAAFEGCRPYDEGRHHEG